MEPEPTPSATPFPTSAEISARLNSAPGGGGGARQLLSRGGQRPPGAPLTSTPMDPVSRFFRGFRQPEFDLSLFRATDTFA
eukprot:1194508-Prorocentrum_minimum.AAC.5